MRYYLTNAPEAYDYFYIRTLGTIEILAPNQKPWRLIVSSDEMRMQSYQIPRYQSGLYQCYAQYSPEYDAVLREQLVTDEWLVNALHPRYETYDLRINMGNAAMQTRKHAAALIRQAANDLENTFQDEGKLRDENGNTVGTWYVMTERSGS